MEIIRSFIPNFLVRAFPSQDSSIILVFQDKHKIFLSSIPLFNIFVQILTIQRIDIHCYEKYN